MEERTLERIKLFLRREEVQEQIQQRILYTRSLITVPIGGAVSLLGFSENQLRKWEEKGLLSPQREGKHRHYSISDLDKLAIIRELIDAKFSPGSIPSDIDRIWAEFAPTDQPGVLERYKFPPAIDPTEVENQHINQRIEHARQELFWRYYASHALRLSLHLIRENIPSTERSALGLVLPFQVDPLAFKAVTQVDQLTAVKESLVGWLASSGSFHTLFTPAPSFEHPGQYRLYQLRALKDGAYIEDSAADRTLLVVNWRLSKLELEITTAKVIRRLLAPLYMYAQNVRACFSQGWRDSLDPATNLNNDYSDHILNDLADMAVHLGVIAGRQNWRFCCILVPDDNALPLQRRSLVVRAQSVDAPHKVGTTLISPNDPTISLSLRAFQSGQVVYRPEVYEADVTIALSELEKAASAIAIPVDGENDTPSAVLYMVADESHAFSEDDQRILRLVGKMVWELLATYHVRQQAVMRITNVITHPEVTSTFFQSKGILSENDFNRDLEVLLRGVLERMQNIFSRGREEISTRMEPASSDVTSLIAIDIDQQAPLANRYGDQFIQNLSKIVGSTLQMQLVRILTNQVAYQLYHACSGRFYLLLDDMPLDEACKHGERIRRRLNDEYEVSILRPISEKGINSDQDNMKLEPISVHVAVLNYTYRKLEGLLQRYSPDTAVGNVRALIDRDIDTALNKGRLEGGNVVMSWDPSPGKRGYIRWPAS